MNIIGPDELVFGVDDVEAAAQYLIDYGLRATGHGGPTGVSGEGGRFEALDGTAVVIARAADPDLPPAPAPACLLRETIYGVADERTLEAIAAEMARDRLVRRGPHGEVSCTDDTGFALRFRRTVRHPYTAPAAPINVPGFPPQRPCNELGASPEMPALPRTLSHIVQFVPDAAKAEAFYQRLGFRTVDVFTNCGPFMRPAGTLDHHTLFLIQAPAFMTGLEHFTFHMGSAQEVLLAGTRFTHKGYQTFWGPGRHLIGSNWFWYFNSPFGCHSEYDADMDLHDDAWVPRRIEANADSSQLFLFTARNKWFPSPDNH